MAQRWYCVNTLPHEERKAKEHLRQQNFITFLPTELIQLKKSAVRKPLFPGYMFVKFDLQDQAWRSIPYTRGVKRLMSSDAERPTPLPRGCVRELYNRLAVLGHVSRPREDIKEGASVEVLAGPFTYWQGIVEKVASERVVVLLSMFGRPTQTTIARSAIRLVS